MSIANINTNTNTTLKKLQDLAKEWADLFGNKAPLTICFSTSVNNMLTINGTVLCPVSEVDADKATFDVEYLFIPTISGNDYEIYLHCPANGPSEIGYIKHITTVYCADSVRTA